MRQLNKNRQPAYLCKKIGDVVDPTFGMRVMYDAPFKIRVNHVPVTADSDIQSFGENVKQIRKVVVSREVGELFSTFDRVYLFGASPDKKPDWYRDNGHTGSEPENGDYANYQVQSVRPQLTETIVYLEKIVGV